MTGGVLPGGEFVVERQDVLCFAGGAGKERRRVSCTPLAPREGFLLAERGKLHCDVAVGREFARLSEGGEGFEDFFNAAGTFWLGGQEAFVDVFGGRAGWESAYNQC
jgi:hypothetical protein